MSQENVEVVRQIFEAFNRRDWEAWASHHHPEVEWTDPAEYPGGGIRRGVGDIRRLFEDLFETGDEWHVELDAVESVGEERVLMRGRSVLVGRVSRIPVEDASSSSSASRTAECVAFKPSGRAPKPSKPWGCGSSRRDCCYSSKAVAGSVGPALSLLPQSSSEPGCSCGAWCTRFRSDNLDSWRRMQSGTHVKQTAPWARLDASKDQHARVMSLQGRAKTKEGVAGLYARSIVAVIEASRVRFPASRSG